MDRVNFLGQINFQFRIHPVVALLGPRQCGKTTLSHLYAQGIKDKSVTWFDLEDPTHLARLARPKLALENLTGLVVIDEIQRAPELFQVLRVLVDRKPNPCQFLILGSASRDLIKQSSETLAGRIGYIELTPFNLSEVGVENQSSLWLRGGFPTAYLAESDEISDQWRKSYITTFLERDIPALGIQIPAFTLRRFWMMLAHYHGQVVNFSELGRSFGSADTTIKRYIDILEGTFMIRQLPPWYEKVKKRQVKSPKLYFRDSGLFHTLLGIGTHETLYFHPKLGASWEGFAIEEIIRKSSAEAGEYNFWSTHGQAEIDLLILKSGRKVGYEVKYTDRPQITKSVMTAVETLNLDEAYVVYPGKETFPLSENVFAVPLDQLLER